MHLREHSLPHFCISVGQEEKNRKTRSPDVAQRHLDSKYNAFTTKMIEFIQDKMNKNSTLYLCLWSFLCGAPQPLLQARKIAEGLRGILLFSQMHRLGLLLENAFH